MLSLLHVHPVSTLILIICLLQSSVSGQKDVTLNIRYDQSMSSEYRINVIFTVELFRGFYGCMCRGNQHCVATYSEAYLPNVIVTKLNWTAAQNNGSDVRPVYNCTNSPRYGKLSCEKLTLPYEYYLVQSLRLNNINCQSSCVTLVWFYTNEFVTFNTDVPDLEFYNNSLSCPSTKQTTSTTVTTTKTSTTPTTSTTTSRMVPTTPTSTTTPTTSPTSSPESFTTTTVEDDDNAGVIAGVVVAVFIFGLVLGILIVIGIGWWRRRKERENKEHETLHSNLPPPSALAPIHVTPAGNPSEDQSSTATFSTQRTRFPPPVFHHSSSYEHPYATISTSVRLHFDNNINGLRFGTPENPYDNRVNVPVFNTGTSNGVPNRSRTSEGTSNTSTVYPASSDTSAGTPTTLNSYVSIMPTTGSES